MRRAQTFASLAATAFSLTALTLPAQAATAHNSQAGGAYGPTKNNCAATAYFPADSGCIGSYVQHHLEGDDGALPRGVRARYRARPPLQ